MWFRIPSDANCPSGKCTVQFTWKTANSCNPHPAAYCNYYHHVEGPQNTWCNNWYCGGFCNSNSNAADNCEATIGNRQCCSEVFAALLRSNWLVKACQRHLQPRLPQLLLRQR